MGPLPQGNIGLAPAVYNLHLADSHSRDESDHQLADQAELDNLPDCNFGLAGILQLAEGGSY